MASRPIMKAPICLVENQNEQLRLNPEALNILNQISQPVVVVAIVGLYRTGKSYLMNCLAGQKPGFCLGSMVRAQTKGIWMLCVPHPLKPDHTLVLLDTQCLGDVEKGDPKNDSWIFALAVLLSSTFVYNSMCTINHQAMEQLHYVTELTELIRMKSSRHEEEDDSTEFVSFFPDFVWTVRDFIFKLKLDGRSITKDEYLENALKLIPEKNSTIKNANLSRECIRRFFPKWKCFVFDRPTSDKHLLHHIEKVPEEQLEATFQKQVKTFCSYIFVHTKTKTLNPGITARGNSLAVLVESYVNAIESGAVLCLENTVTTLARRENLVAVQKAADHYNALMAQRLRLPTDTLQEFLDVHAACEKEAIAVFLEYSFKDENQEFHRQLMITMEKEKENFVKQNEEASDKYCHAELKKLSETLMRSISRGIFSGPGGYSLYLEAKENLEQAYSQVPRKGVKANEVLQKFLKSQVAVEESILQSDNAFTEEEKAITVEQAKVEAAEKENELLKQKEKEQQQNREADEKSFKEHIAQLEAKMMKEREMFLKEQEIILQHELKMQKQLLEEGFKKKSEKYERAIKRRRQEMEENSGVVECVDAAANEVLQKFLKSQVAVEESILQSDNAFTEEEKAITVEQAKVEAAEKENELLKQKEKEQQQNMEADQKSFKEHITQLEAKWRKDREKFLKEKERILQHELKMQKQLLEEGFKEKSEEYERGMKQRREEMEKNSGVVECVDAAVTVLSTPFKLLASGLDMITSPFRK
ncbi:LOW QUALITY PROTEIN: guanylate-binding protein 7-like [Rhynchocyon petersi]